MTVENSTAQPGYELRISRQTVDKLGVKLYDKASAVVAELVANGYDADAALVEVDVPLGTALTRKADGTTEDLGFAIVVRDDGHGMTPEEAQEHYLRVGRNRRDYPDQGEHSRERGRPVMGRKGIGKLAPFGICRRIEVISAGGEPNDDGYLTTHFVMDYDTIVTDEDDPVALEVGEHDRSRRATRGTEIRLSGFLPKRVPDRETFVRQLARRFVLAGGGDFEIRIRDTKDGDAPPFTLEPFEIPTMDGTRIHLGDQPVVTEDGTELPVEGWLGLAREAYQNEEMAGVRIYARRKLAATTRDFEQPAGYTGEFTARSYLVGEVRADWLDLDEGEDLIKTDRQEIIWESDYGRALRTWGGQLIRRIGEASREPRRRRVRQLFSEASGIEELARERFEDLFVVDAALELAEQIGQFAAEDELEDTAYVHDLAEVILSVAPHKALIDAFQDFQTAVGSEAVTLDRLADLFGKTRVAELASYGQIAAERVHVLGQLEEIIASGGADEAALQRILTEAPWLIEPEWTVLSQNQSLKTFEAAFERYLRDEGLDAELVVDWADLGNKRPDFVLVSVARVLHVVEIKAAGHTFDDDDFTRLHRYIEALRKFEEAHGEVLAEFRSWRIDLVADAVNLGGIPTDAYEKLLNEKVIERRSWNEFLARARRAHEQFLAIRDAVQRRAAELDGAED